MKGCVFVAAAVAASHAFAADAVQVHVSGAVRDINGTTQIPVGLFGVHATKLTPERAEEWGIHAVRLIHQAPSGNPVLPGTRGDVPAGIEQVVECFYDRYQPARLLVDKNWKENLEKLARTYGENAKKDPSRTYFVEFWNEPFLNWAAKPGVNYDPMHFESKDRVEGAPVTIKGQEKPTEHLVWSKKLVAVDAKSGAPDHLAASYMPQVIEVPATQPEGKPTTRPVREGDTYNFRNRKEMKVVESWWAKDPTQKSYYSGRQNGTWYNRMLVPFARAMKEANGDVQIAAGWGFHISSGGWDAWHTLYKPMIDESIQWIDAVHEHHYGGDTRMVPATYEVVAAYAKTTHNKTLKFWNTEAGGFLDPQRPDTPARPKLEYSGAQEHYGRYLYTVRDIVHILDNCPDKAIHRASHGAGDESDGVAFRLLKPLRGRLLHTSTSDPRLWCVASSPGNGSDRQTILLFNDVNETRDVQITLPPGVLSVTRTDVKISDDKLELVDTPLKADAALTLNLAAKSATRLLVTLAPADGKLKMVRERQHFAPGVLQRVEKDKPLTLEVAVPAEHLAHVQAARLKIVQQGLNAKNVTLTLNGTVIPLEIRTSWTHMQEIDPKLLREKNTVELKLADEGTPFTLNMASLITVQ